VRTEIPVTDSQEDGCRRARYVRVLPENPGSAAALFAVNDLEQEANTPLGPPPKGRPAWVSRRDPAFLTERLRLLRTQGTQWILAVEDSESDAYLLQQAINRGPEPEPILRVGDGEEAIALLQELAEGETGSFPDLIVIDINLPRANGYEVLNVLSASKAFKEIPIVVVTSSRQEADRKKALAAGADAFFVKPLDLASYGRLPAIIHEARRVRSVKLTPPHKPSAER
jgi:CheY-like chemotaxis protein